MQATKRCAMCPVAGQELSRPSQVLTLPATVSVSERMYERCSLLSSSSSSASSVDVRAQLTSLVADDRRLLLSIIATSAF